MKLRTASGFSVDRRCARGLENLAASEGENPQEFSRYSTMKWGSGDMVPPTAAAASTEEEKKRRSRRRRVSNKGRRLLRRSTERSVAAAIVGGERGTLMTPTLHICILRNDTRYIAYNSKKEEKGADLMTNSQKPHLPDCLRSNL
ncbi:hypothetical protein MUK42_25155 [Musa troglodytarum]|uniref:Uncharacterized protein n=1 Tax=Musa troglodytarum TaxID=320322 RepID=A0A9E7IGS9_9LILI|nr:hypothetical protein MUK42_25155 [Musa troglodytarum]